MSVYYPNIINPNTPNAGGGTVPFTNPMTGALDLGGYEVVNSTDGITSPNSLATVGQVNQLIASNTSSIFCPTIIGTYGNISYKSFFSFIKSRNVGQFIISNIRNKWHWDVLCI